MGEQGLLGMLCHPNGMAWARRPSWRTSKRCIATREGLPQLPDVPTVAESGYPDFEMTQWHGLNAPSSMPQAAIDKMAEVCAKAMRNPQATERLRGDTAQPVGDTPAQYAAFIKAEQARWKLVAERARIKPD